MMNPRLLAIAPSALVCSTLLGLGLLILPPARAEKLEQTQQLITTKECPRCDLSRAGLVFAQLAGANLRAANLSGANLSRADLQGADLRGANLSGASLFGANLLGARLDGAQLVATDLRGAYLVQTSFVDATLDHALLQGAIGLSPSVGKAEDFYRWAIAEGQQKNYARAAENFTQAVARKADYAEAYMGRSGARLTMGDRKGAIADAETAATLFKAQGKVQEVQLAEAFVKEMKAPPPKERTRGSNLGSSLLSVFGTLAQFFLLF